MSTGPVSLQLNVQAFHASEGGDASTMEGVNVAICTIEKANSIVNRLAEETRLEVRWAWFECHSLSQRASYLQLCQEH